MLAGFIQIIFGGLGLGVLSRLIPYSVQTGFVNAMSMVIFFAQFTSFKVKPILEAPLFARKMIEVGYSTTAFDNDTPWESKSVIVVLVFEAIIAYMICYFLPKLTSKASNVSVAILSVAVIEWIIVRQVGYLSPLKGDYVNITKSIL